MCQCPLRCFSGCREELHQERIIWKAETRRINICSIGPLLELNHDSKDDPGLDTVDLEDKPISVEEGNWILATGLLPPQPMEIHALSTISQWLAEAFQVNMEAAMLIPEYLKEFTTVFSK